MSRRLLIVALLAATACTAPERGISPHVVPGEVNYRARSASGQLLLEGRLTILMADDSSLRGSWEIGWAPGADTTTAVGPQVGIGWLVGFVQDDAFVVQLNPDYADNNVGFTVRPSRDGWRGEWGWTGIIGPITGGSVEMTLVPGLTTNAVVRYVNLEGGCWVLEAAGTRYEPVNLPADYKVDGLVVQAELSQLRNMVSTCMVGPMVSVRSISGR